MNVLGTHLLLELWNCDTLKINDPDYLAAILGEAASILDAIVLNSVFCM